MHPKSTSDDVPQILSGTPTITGAHHLIKFEIHARVIHDDQLEPLRTLIRSDTVLASATTVFGGADATVVYAPDEEVMLFLAAERERENVEAEKVEQRWERTTNLRLFGGLVGLRMESRR